MAHVQHYPAVFERLLRPIFDSLEVGNTKKALQEAEKVLKKNPTIQCARALKALALIRMGREDEAQGLIESVAIEKPCDDPTLYVMTFCYKEQEQFDKICELYTHAAKQIPGNEEILSQLFMSHVRVNDFQSQQTVALQLYKLKPKNPYYFWAVMSVVLKAVRGPDAKDVSKSKVLLALAQRMIDKLIGENKLDVEQEVQLYLTILRYQGKHQDALDFLEGDLGRRLYPGAPISLTIDLMKSLKMWPKLNVLMKSLLLDNKDRWDYYKEYILTVVELKKSTDSEDVAECCFQHCRDFLKGLIDNSTKNVRGPYLGQLELHRTMTEQGHNANEMIGDFLELLVQYFNMFGDKQCCANDIILFLDALEQYSRADLANRLLQDCEISSTTLPRSKEQMQKHICSLQISRICGAHALNAEHLVALYTAFSLHYEHGLTAFGGDCLATDMGPSDSYALLAVHVMYDLAVKIQSSEPIIEALCLLHYLLGNSPSNFHAKLLCLHLYHIIGCGIGAQQMHNRLDIKHVQLDSMGYLHCAHLPRIGIQSIAKPLYGQTLKFFTTSYKESLEYLAMCYKFGSFSKLEEFMDFRERLSNSLHYSMISAEMMLMEMNCMGVGNGSTIQTSMNSIKSMNIMPCEDRINWMELTDNRDLTVICRWDPNLTIHQWPTTIGKNNHQEHHHKTDDDDDNSLNDVQQQRSHTKESDESFCQDVDLLRIRVTLLRLIDACIDGVSMKQQQHQEQQQITTQTAVDDVPPPLIQLHKQWIGTFEKIRAKNYQLPSNMFLVNLLPSRLHGMLMQPYEKHFTQLSRMILVLHQLNNNDDCNNDDVVDECPNKVAKEYENNIEEIGQLLVNTIRKHNEESDIVYGRRNVQEIVVNCIEILSLSALVLSICHHKYSTSVSTTKQNKKSKKRIDSKSTTIFANDKIKNADNLSDKDRLHIYATLAAKLKLEFQNCDYALDSWKTPGVSDNLADRIAAMSLNPKVETVVNKMLRDSHSTTVQELKIIIRDKCRMLNSITSINGNAAAMKSS